MVLDGGPCREGLESTVVDVTGPVVRVLRPGPITVPMLERVVGKVETANREPAQGERIARSPGQMGRHYCPRTQLRLVDPNDLLEDSIEARWAGLRAGTVSFFRTEGGWDEVTGENGLHISLPADPERAAPLLYATLHRLDELGLDLLIVEMPPDTPEWSAIRDRLSRAASRN